jgi:hypothetical protein
MEGRRDRSFPLFGWVEREVEGSLPPAPPFCFLPIWEAMEETKVRKTIARFNCSDVTKQSSLSLIPSKQSNT